MSDADFLTGIMQRSHVMLNKKQKYESIVGEFYPHWSYGGKSIEFFAETVMELFGKNLRDNIKIHSYIHMICEEFDIRINEFIVSLIFVKDNDVLFYTINFNDNTISKDYNEDSILTLCVNDNQLLPLWMSVYQFDLDKLCDMWFNNIIQVKPLWFGLLIVMTLKGEYTVNDGINPEIELKSDTDNDSLIPDDIKCDISNNTELKPYTIENNRRQRFMNECLVRRNPVEMESKDAPNHDKYTVYDKGAEFFYDKWDNQYRTENNIYIETIYPTFEDEMMDNELWKIPDDKLKNKITKIKSIKKRWNKHISSNMKAKLSKDNEIKYRIKNNSVITDGHLLAIILYTDETQLCTILRKTYYDPEYIGKHAELAHFGRLLYEATQVYGKPVEYNTVLYIGINQKLIFDLCTHILNTYLPLSTTTDETVAKKFASMGDGNGIVIAVRPYLNVDANKYIDVSLFSDFQESELFFHGNTSMEVDFDYIENFDFGWKWKNIDTVTFHKIFRRIVLNWKSLINPERIDLDANIVSNMDFVLESYFEGNICDDINEKRMHYSKINIEIYGLFDTQTQMILGNLDGCLCLMELKALQTLFPRWIKMFVSAEKNAYLVSNIIKAGKNLTGILISCTNTDNDGLLINDIESIEHTINDLIYLLKVKPNTKLNSIYLKYNTKSRNIFGPDLALLIHDKLTELNSISHNIWDIKYDLNKCWILIHHKTSELFNYKSYGYIFGNSGYKEYKFNNKGLCGSNIIDTSTVIKALKNNFNGHDILSNALKKYIKKKFMNLHLN